MRTYVRTYVTVKDVNPPDAFQPKHAIVVVDESGAEIELLFKSSDQMANAASTLADCSMEADLRFRDLMREHFEQARDIQTADEDRAYEASVDDARYFNQDDYEFPEAS